MLERKRVIKINDKKPILLCYNGIILWCHHKTAVYGTKLFLTIFTFLKLPKIANDIIKELKLVLESLQFLWFPCLITLENQTPVRQIYTKNSLLFLHWCKITFALLSFSISLDNAMWDEFVLRKRLSLSRHTMHIILQGRWTDGFWGPAEVFLLEMNSSLPTPVICYM